MQIKFDSLNRFETPMMTLCNPGSVYSNGTISRVVGAINYTTDEEVVLNFNSRSTLNFRATKLLTDGTLESDYALRVYKGLQNRRLIFVEGIGYFIITDVSEDYDGGITYKDVVASSCEIEIQNKALVYIEDGTYKFTDLLERIVSTIPRWLIGYIDESVANRHRTFEDVDITKNTLSFFIEDVQDAYECIFIFDTMNRVINIYDQSSYTLKTDIHLTKDDLISSMIVSENIDDLYTALNVRGDNDLTISAINPLGSSTIYDFSYYLDWMSEGLRNKVCAWSALVEYYLDSYYQLNTQYYELSAQISDLSSEISRLQMQIDVYKRCKENIKATLNADNVPEYNKVLEENGGKQITIHDSIDEILSEIDALIEKTQADIDNTNLTLESVEMKRNDVNKQLGDINNRVSFQSHFSQLEYEELSDYIYEGTYTDEYITTTDSMTMSEKLVQMKDLYSKAARKLNAVSTPTREFNVDMEEFIFIDKFQNWSSQLEAGCIINVEVDEDDVVELFLTSIQFNWHDNTFALTFGNRFNKSDPQSLFNDVLGDIKKSANSINYIKNVIRPVKNGEFEEFKEEIENAGKLSLDASISSESGEIQIDATGYTGKKQAFSSYSSRAMDIIYELEQLKITGNTIVFTEDAWDTCTTLLGAVKLNDLSHIYGLNAQAIVGGLILNDRLNIYDENGTPILSIIDNKISVCEDKLATLLDHDIDKINVRMDGMLISIDYISERVSEACNALAAQEELIYNLRDKVNSMQGDVIRWYDFSEVKTTGGDS